MNIVFILIKASLILNITKKAKKAIDDFLNNKRLLKQIKNQNAKIIKKTPNSSQVIKINTTVGYVYVIKLDNFYKIGRTSNPEQRIQQYITENPNKIKVILCKKVKDYVKTEKELHLKFENKNHNREWFKLDDEDILSIKNYLKEKNI